MGCTGSKEVEDGGETSGGGPSGGADADTLAAAGGHSSSTCGLRNPMTPKQKYCIGASWKGINRELKPTGVYMFVKLFEEHPETLDLFQEFSTLRTREQQEESLEFAEFALIVMTTLDQAISFVDKPDEFVQFLEQVGSSHGGIPGFNKDYFWKIERPFLEAVKHTLGDRYTDNMDGIYKIAITLIIKTLISGCERGY